MLARYVGQALDGCKWVGVVFAGGFSEARYISARTPVVNDLHRHIIALARVVAHPIQGPQLIRRLRRLAYHPDVLLGAQERCKAREGVGYFLDLVESAEDELLGWAEDYFVCAWASRNGTAGTKKEFNAPFSVRWEAGGGDSCVRFRSAIEALSEWGELLRRATFNTLDWPEFLIHCKDQEGHGIYCDPPFPGPGDAYKHSFTKADHEHLAHALAEYKQTRVVCRFYDVPLIRELYPEPHWRWLLLTGRKQTNAEALEVLLTNFNQPGI